MKKIKKTPARYPPEADSVAGGKQTEKKFRVALDYAESIIATLREPFLVVNRNLRIVSANRSFYTTFEVTEKETIGQLLPNLGNRQWNIPKLLHLLKEILPKKTVVESYEIEHDFDQIGHRIMELNARKLRVPREIAIAITEEEEEEELILLAIEDITERERAEKEVQKAREYAESIINTIHEPLVVLDGELRVVSVSRSFYQTFKVKPKETEGEFIYDLGNRQWDVPKLRELLERILLKNTSFDNFEVVHDFPKIGKRTMLLNARRIPRPPAKPRIILLAIEDITERRKIQKRAIETAGLKEKLEQQREIDEMKTEFVSVVSHQLRTPLSAIKWFLEMVLSGDAGEITTEQRSYLQQVFDSNERMIRLVNDLLNVSRIEMGRMLVEPAPTDLVKLAKEVISDFEKVVKTRKQSLTLKSVGKIPEVSFDPDLVRQVFQNLLSNATNYTPKDGKITVKIWVEGQEIILSVRDSGCGIPINQRGEIFTKFFRASNIVRRQQDGSGLGLYIAKGIIETLGGRLWFESEENKGSTFSFSLPLSGSPKKAGEVKLSSVK